MSNYVSLCVAAANELVHVVATRDNGLFRSFTSQYGVHQASWRLTLLIVMLLSGLSAKAQNQTYYLKPNGNDQLDGRSVENAFANIYKFASIAQPGDQLLIKGGIYYGQTIKLEQFGNNGLKGEPGREIVIKNVDGEVPIFEGTAESDDFLFYTSTENGTKSVRYITFEGLVMRNYDKGGLAFDGNVTTAQRDDYTQSDILFDHITVRRCIADNCGQKGIHFAGCSDILVEDCISSRNGWSRPSGSWSSNFNFFKCWGSNLVARRCIAFHGVDVSDNQTDGNGFILDLSYRHASLTLENCVSFNNGGTGFQFTESEGGRLINCTSYENSQEPTYRQGGDAAGIGFYGPDAINNVTLVNTVVVQSTGRPVFKGYWTNTGVLFTNFTNSNVSNNTISGENGYANPNFTNPPTDVSLQSNSPLINAGSSGGTGDALFYDSNIIQYQTSGQNIGWWRYAPNYDYIINRGGLKNCIYSTSVNGTRDIGATEYAGSTPNPGGGSSQSIYADSFVNGWYDGGGWDYTANVGNTFPVKSGSNSAAVSFSGVNYGAWIIARSSAQSTSGFSGFRFWAYGADGGNTIQFVVKVGGNETGRTNVTLAGGVWQEYTVPFSQVGNPSSVDEFWIHNSSSTATGTFYLDDIRLVSSGGGRRGAEVSSERLAGISVYPNPANEKVLTVVTPFIQETKGVVSITDMSGFTRLQQKATLSRETKVVLPNDLSPSVYIITLKDDTTGRLYKTKFIKQ